MEYEINILQKESYCYEVTAKDEYEAKEKATKLHYDLVDNWTAECVDSDIEVEGYCKDTKKFC